MNNKTIDFQTPLNLNDNCFDLLRYIGAVIVVLSHSFRWFGINKPFYSLFFTDGSIGVMIFFSMTGFLIMPAYERQMGKDKSILKFYWNRAIRIYPAILFSFLVISIIDFFFIGVDFSLVSYAKYFFKYVFLCKGAGYNGGISNGILWTIIPDLVFYLLTPFIWKVMHNAKTHTWIIVIMCFYLFNLYDKEVITSLQSIPLLGLFVNDGFFLCFIYEFLIGSFLYCKRDSILSYFINKRYLVVAFLAAFSIFHSVYTYTGVFTKAYIMHSPVTAPFACFLNILIGYAFGRIKMKIAITYGIYIFHMVIVGLLLWAGVKDYSGVIITLATTPILAFVSYYFVEKPFLRLKA